MSSNQEELISQFKDITGTTDDRARFYLESSNWTLNTALSSFYENQGENDDFEDSANFDNSFDNNLLRPAVGEVLSTSAAEEKSPKMSQNDKQSNSFKKSTKPRIATLHNMSQRSSDEEEGQAFYAGGSERSGQQVLGPPKKKNFREQLTEIFRMAHESGAVVDPSTEPQASSSSRDRSYQGVGLRLGQTESDHTKVGEEERRERPHNIEPVVLKLWSQGFSINDGDLRPYDEPENREFIESVTRGQIPNELRQMGSMVSVDLEDHRHEDFKKPPTKMKTFKGSGHTLGSPAPSVSGTTPTSSSVNTIETVSIPGNEDHSKRAVEQLKVDKAQPTTMIQIRLSDGSRISGQFNLSHTIEDIRQYIVISRPQYEQQNFILVTAFPTKELTDSTQTIEKAGLANASLMQRLK